MNEHGAERNRNARSTGHIEDVYKGRSIEQQTARIQLVATPRPDVDAIQLVYRSADSRSLFIICSR